MYEENEIELTGSQCLSNICYVCLSRSRKTVVLGEYAEIFHRIIYYSAKDNQHIKLCWECLAMLKRIKVFETKCYIAQKILHAKWENHQPPNCLSTLVTTPVTIDENDGIKTEEIPIEYQQNYTANTSYENYGHINEHDEIFTKEENTSIEDVMDDRSENIEYYKKESNLNCNEFNSVEKDIKIEVKVTDEFKSNFETSTDLNKEINIVYKPSQFKKQKKNIKKGRKGVRKKDLEEHFKIVAVSEKDLKKFRIKRQINDSELEFWRETEKTTNFYLDQPFKCHSCICTFPSVKKQFEHDKKYHNRNSGFFTCDICKSQFKSKQDLSTHVSKHYFVHQCNLCQMRCISRSYIKYHMYRHKRIVMCAYCDDSFANVNLFYKHFKSNHSEYICDHCGKRCRTKYTMEKHMRHHSEKNICLICNKVYASRNSLRNHIEMKHNETLSEMAYCVKCDKQFGNVPLYKRHVQTSKAHATERDANGNQKQVNCPVCGNVYSRKTYMMNHYRHVHMKQSKHYCTDCDRHFLNRTRYVEHRKYQHEGEPKAKTKMCNICGRGFAANRTLVNHIRTHSGERPYECQYCDAKFTQKHGMLSHIKYIHMKSKRRGFN